jgi:hypothetical protein
MAELTVAAPPAEEQHARSRDAYRLRMVSRIYLSLALGGLVSFFVPISFLTAVVGEMFRYGSFFAFLVGWAFAFRLQSKAQRRASREDGGVGSGRGWSRGVLDIR